jgi:polyhydroxyalkanoate synthesis regulator phasin
MKYDLGMAMKKRVGKVIDQAKQSLKILEMLEKETLSKAKNFVKASGDTKKLTNDKILASLKKLGVPSQSEVDALRSRVEKLEAQLALHQEETMNEIPQ